MKPIIIAINDGKISMTVDEFKKHIEDAYQQGYKDGSSSLTTVNDPYWWRYLTTNTNTNQATDHSITGTLATKVSTVDNGECNNAITAKSAL